MSWTSISAFALDQIAAYQDLNEIRGNIIAVKEAPKALFLGGDPGTLYTNTAYQEVTFPIRQELPDSSNLAGLTFELWGMGIATAADTVTVQLWNDTDSSEVVAFTFTNTTLDTIKSASFTLPSGTNKTVTVRVKAATGGASSPFRAYGFALVQR
jgi:hypothetical protein